MMIKVSQVIISGRRSWLAQFELTGNDNTTEGRTKPAKRKQAGDLQKTWAFSTFDLVGKESNASTFVAKGSSGSLFSRHHVHKRLVMFAVMSSTLILIDVRDAVFFYPMLGAWGYLDPLHVLKVIALLRQEDPSGSFSSFHMRRWVSCSDSPRGVFLSVHSPLSRGRLWVESGLS